MPSNSRNLSSLLGTDTKIATDDISGVQIGIGFYANEAALPTDGNLLGAKAYAESEGTLHFWNGASWGALSATEYEVPAGWIAGQGSVSGYTSGGHLEPVTRTIDKFSFASDANATSVGNIDRARGGSAGTSSDVNGYAAGGGDYVNAGFYPARNDIDKFPFAADGNAVEVANLSITRGGVKGISSQEHGYGMGGSGPPGTTGRSLIDKFPFAADGNAVLVGDQSYASHAEGTNGSSSTTFGYTGGVGIDHNNSTNRIEKFPFAIDGNTTDVGDLTINRDGAAAQHSSDVSGYTSGGNGENVIDKWSFAADGNATDVGDLTNSRGKTAGQSSNVSGYTSGGNVHATNPINTIDKFPFAADANATDVGDLTVARKYGAGQQV